MSAGTLAVVATPIGNLDDITLRALRVLREADVIAAEDTRRTARLLAHHAIQTPTVSFHEHNSRNRLPQLIARLEAGEAVALVTDAGTPGVSDPGVELVRACVEKGIPVDPIPGASAPLTAAVAAGFPLAPFTILGFPPVRGKDRIYWFEATSALEHTFSFFEAPHRIVRTLAEGAMFWGNRQIVAAREMTKIHQELLRGTARELSARLAEPRGEFTMVVGPDIKVSDNTDLNVSDDELIAQFGQYTENEGLGRREAVSTVARKYGKPAREVYAAIERAKKAAS